MVESGYEVHGSTYSLKSPRCGVVNQFYVSIKLLEMPTHLLVTGIEGFLLHRHPSAIVLRRTFSLVLDRTLEELFALFSTLSLYPTLFSRIHLPSQTSR